MCWCVRTALGFVHIMDGWAPLSLADGVVFSDLQLLLSLANFW